MFRNSLDVLLAIHYNGMIDFKSTITNVCNASMDLTAKSRLHGLKLEVRGFLCTTIKRLITAAVQMMRRLEVVNQKCTDRRKISLLGGMT